MEREAFFKKIEYALGEYMPEVGVSVTEVTKNNGLILHGLVIRREGTKVSPTIYLEQFYDRYENGTTFADIITDLEKVINECTGEGINVDYFSDFDEVKDRIVCKIINYDMNSGLLNSVPFVRWNDLAIVFCHICDESIAGYATILIRNSHLEMWHVTGEDIYEYARKNTPRLMHDELSTIDELLKDMIGGPLPGGLRNGIDNDPDNPVAAMYVLTNSKRIFGATSMLYSGYLKELSDRFGSGLYILPSSIHEVILLPENDVYDPDFMREMICEVNESEVSLEERLSDNLYYYDRNTEEIRIAG